MLLLAGFATAATPKRVLVVHSFGNAAPPFTTHSTAFERALAEKMGRTVDIDEVSLDVARYATLDMEEALVDLMRARQAKWQPDLVVPIGSPAGAFVARHRAGLFPAETPIIYAGMDKRRLPADALDHNATFVGESFDVAGWIEDILEIAPDTKNIAVVIGASPLEQVWTEILRREFRRFEDRVSFTWMDHLPVDEILKQAKQLPPKSFIFVVLMMRDASGVTHNGDVVLQQIHAVANAPISAIFQHQLGLGIVGGRLQQAEEEGIEAARRAARILAGEPASTFPPLIIGPLPPRYDWRELKKWNIDEKSLPKGSEVLFRAPTFWEQYRWQIMAVCAVVLLQAALICMLIANLLRRRRAERSLTRSEERVALAAEAAQLGVWELNTATGTIWVSDKARELFELPGRGELDRSSFSALVHPEDRRRRDAAVDRAISEQGEYAIEYRICLPDHGTRWISGRGRYMPGDGRKSARLIGVSLDVTDRKRSEEETRRQRHQIELLARASLVGEMIGSLAHELIQPLSAIRTNANAGLRFTEGGTLDPGVSREIFADIGADACRAGEIIHRVRNAIKDGSEVRGRVSMNKLIENTTLIMQPDAAAFSCQMQTSLSESLPLVEGDPIQLQQILINLMTNAFHAMRETPPAARKIEISTEANGDAFVRVVIRDHGTGIPDDNRAKLFEQFYTTKTDGLGMGLAIVRSIVEAHSGTVTAENVETGGALFAVELPVARSHSPY